ncbi:AEC family transporter [Pseudomonas sp. TUM22785]|uniref:AEC family transporter n=1 Tax=Pseudomonas sp. TUM22785 TaxID=3019098 RepID=UPI002305DFEA|nr:AEC family transporter [Pseudomonas sp. TUM22785]WCD78822.1 AEC family transporter [Pseudomonas sp. TUM22785]
MLDVITITAPVFLIIGLGFAASLGGLVSREQVRGIGAFVLNFALPALVIKALAERPIGEVFNPWYLLAYGLGSLAVFGLGLAYFRLLRGRGLADAAIAGLGMSASNSGFVGYPVVVMVAGPTAVLGLALNMVVENLLMIPLALALAESAQQRGEGFWHTLRGTFGRLARNPLIIAMLVGVGLSLLGLRLPTVPARVVEMLASASAPAALFVIGGTLHGVRLGGLLPDMAAISLGKLALHPLAVAALFWLLPPVEPALMAAGILFACAPMMSIYPLLGMRFGLEARCAATLVMATVLSFFGLSLAIALLQR